MDHIIPIQPLSFLDIPLFLHLSQAVFYCPKDLRQIWEHAVGFLRRGLWVTKAVRKRLWVVPQ